MPFLGDMLVPWRANPLTPLPNQREGAMGSADAKVFIVTHMADALQHQ